MVLVCCLLTCALCKSVNLNPPRVFSRLYGCVRICSNILLLLFYISLSSGLNEIKDNLVGRLNPSCEQTKKVLEKAFLAHRPSEQVVIKRDLDLYGAVTSGVVYGLYGT